MKIAYISSVDLNSKQAQANQVKSMFRAFDDKLKGDFFGCTTSNYKKIKNVYSKNIKLKGKLRKFIAPFIFIPLIFQKNIKKVYCREIFIAFIYVLLNRRVIFELHEFNGTLRQKFLLGVLSKFNNFRVVTVSKFGEDYLLKNYKGIKCQSLPNGVFLEDYDKLLPVKKYLKKELYSSYNERFKAVYTGSLYKGKDVEVIFNLARLSENIAFICIGGTSCHFKEIACKFPDVINIYHISYLEQSQVVKYQIAADFLIYPISKENKIKDFTSPLKLFEYMASRTPIVATSLGAVNEIINEKLCYIIHDDEAQNIKQLQTAMDDVEQPDNRKASAAYNFVKDNCTWASRIDKIIILFCK